jgi:hypothetical protein
MLLQAIAQLEMLATAFEPKAPERARVAAKEFQESLKEWSNA